MLPAIAMLLNVSAPGRCFTASDCVNKLRFEAAEHQQGTGITAQERSLVTSLLALGTNNTPAVHALISDQNAAVVEVGAFAAYVAGPRDSTLAEELEAASLRGSAWSAVALSSVAGTAENGFLARAFASTGRVEFAQGLVNSGRSGCVDLVTTLLDPRTSQSVFEIGFRVVSEPQALLSLDTSDINAAQRKWASEVSVLRSQRLSGALKRARGLHSLSELQAGLSSDSSLVREGVYRELLDAHCGERGPGADALRKLLAALVPRVNATEREQVLLVIGCYADEPSTTLIADQIRTEDWRTSLSALRALGYSRQLSGASLATISSTAKTYWLPEVRDAASDVLSGASTQPSFAQALGFQLPACRRLPSGFFNSDRKRVEGDDASLKDLPASLRSGRRCEVRVDPHRRLVGVDAGEQGGGLWVLSDGPRTPPEQIVRFPVVDLFRSGDRFFGISNDGSLVQNRSVLFEVASDSSGLWTLANEFVLPGPAVAVDDSSGGFTVTTVSGTVRFTSDATGPQFVSCDQ